MRYLPLNDQERATMRDVVGVSSIEELFADVPAGDLNPDLDLPRHQGEMAVERHITQLSNRNVAAGSVPFFAGCGAYKHHVPATVDHIIQRSEFLTAYTPYQPEIAQGTLQYLFEFQTQVATLTGMDIANASMYDGSTAAAEAALMARRVTKRKKVVCSGGLHPHYEAVIRTNSELIGDQVVWAASTPEAQGGVTDLIDEDTSCVIVQSPDVFGNVRDLRALAAAAHEKGALLIAVVTEAISFGLLQSPGSQGADIVVGEGQSIGNALNFGGPYLGLFAAREKLVRHMPGRLCGETTDADGRRGYVLTLSTREQHIRRDKATSNICTNSGLCALAFTVHMSLLGGQGLRSMATLNHEAACATADALTAIDGVELLTPTFFNEFTVRLPVNAEEAVERLAENGIIAGVPGGRLWPGDDALANLLIVAATEVTTDADIKALSDGLSQILAG